MAAYRVATHTRDSDVTDRANRPLEGGGGKLVKCYVPALASVSGRSRVAD